MKKMKKRLALLLCMMLAIPAALGCLPMTSLRAEAAGGSFSMTPYDGKIEIEAGKKVPLAKLTVYREGYSGRMLETVKDATYKSDNTAVAAVDSKGKVSAKKAGTAKITITYQDATTTYTIQVVKKGAHKSAKYTKILDLAKKLDSYKNKKITASNRYLISQLNGQYENACDDVVDGNGFEMKRKNGTLNYTGKLVLPELMDLNAGVNATDEKLHDYASKNNPVGTIPGKCFKIKSVSAKKNSKTFTIQLTSKVNATQIFAIKEYTNWLNNYGSKKGDTVIENDKTACFPIYLIDQKTGYQYRGLATAKEKSSQITVTMNYCKLKAKGKYQIVGSLRDSSGTYAKGWTKGKTFTVK